MDDARKYAYRMLLYRAMLQIRMIQWAKHRWLQLPSVWRQQARAVKAAGAVADWLHNLANYSSADFEGFEEALFWSDFESLVSNFPEVAYYKAHFDGAVRELESGNAQA